MDTPQLSFFPDDDGTTPKRAATRSLIVRAQPGRPLSKPPQAFNKLVAPAEKLGAPPGGAPQPGRPLSKPQQAFNKLVATVEKLRARLEQTIRQLDEALVFHAHEVR